VVALVVAALVTRRELSHDSPPRERLPWRRWLVVLVSGAFAWIAVAEVVTGGHFADAMLLVWPLGLVWCWLFLIQDRHPWRARRAMLWAVAPVCVVVVLVLEVTTGLFSVRFDHSRHELVAAAQQIAAGDVSPVGERVGSFDIVVRRQPPTGCVASFVIDGWWRDDKRWVAWCPDGRPTAVAIAIRSLGGGWYQLIDR
jgi:peptidoglycan/LPS O-acetylase OafA/YrhL